MFRINDAKQALKVDVAISPGMQSAIDLWGQMFMEQAPWLDSSTKSLGLAAAIAGEHARLITVELESEISGSARADFLQKEYKRTVLDDLRTNVEIACAAGGLVFKPYIDGKHLAVDCVPAWRFFPTTFNSRKEVTGAVFVEQVTKGKTYYTRMEHHQMTDAGYQIRNMAFRSQNNSTLGSQCDLAEVEEWATLEPEVVIGYKDGSVPEGALFSYFRIPWANNIDPESPLGVSVCSRSADLIQEADKQYSRILWEYEGSELAIDASMGALRVTDENGNVRTSLPARNRRLFRELGIDQGDSDLYKVFSPAIRDSSLFAGLNNLLKRIEFNSYLSYGTLSDPQQVDKTAEEIRSSKQRSYSAVCDLQRALQKSLDHLVWVLDFYTSLYKLAPAGAYKVSFSWGDGVLQDTDKEREQMRQDCRDGAAQWWEYRMRFYGETEEEAKAAVSKDNSDDDDLMGFNNRKKGKAANVNA